MKKIGTISLGLLFIIYLFGIQFIYWSELSDARKNSCNSITEKSLNLYFSPAQFKSLSWTDGKKEFSFNNIRYDVINTEIVNGQVKIKCTSDEKETHLVLAYSDFLEKFVNAHQQSSDSKGNKLIKVYKDYLPQTSSVIYANSPVYPLFPLLTLVSYYSYSSSFWTPPKSIS